MESVLNSGIWCGCFWLQFYLGTIFKTQENLRVAATRFLTQMKRVRGKAARPKHTQDHLMSQSQINSFCQQFLGEQTTGDPS